MRRRTVSAIAVASSLTLAAGVMAASSEAYTAKELNMCWVNHSLDESIDLEVVADGPTYKTASLDNGDCMAWDVRPGQYKLTVEDVDEFLASIADAKACPGPKVPLFRITIKRMQDTYKAYNPTTFGNGGITTTVKKDRRTSVTALLNCK